MKAGMRNLNALGALRVLRALGVVAVLALAGPAHGQECSGGSAGGTDATGNQCNGPAAIEAAGDRPGFAPSAAASNAQRDPAAKRAAAGGAKPAANPDRAQEAPAAQMGAAAHRKQVFDERRARFNDGGHARVAEAQPANAAGPLRGANASGISSGTTPAP
jgi:hypothetical protein